MQFSSALMDFWLLSVSAILILPVAVLVGWLSGRHTYIANDYARNPPAIYPGETTTGAIIGLLGLLLAFTFGFALTQSEYRKKAQLEETNAISTAFFNAELLKEPGATNLRRALTTYAKTRVVSDDLRSNDDFIKYLNRSIQEQNKIWPALLNAADDDDNSPAIIALNTSGLTSVLDAHTRRLAAGAEHIPLIAKSMLCLCGMAALFIIGNNAALRGRSLSWRPFVFSSVLSVVMIVIVDLERPHTGFIRLNPAILEITVAEMESALNK